MSNESTMEYVMEILSLTKWLVDMDIEEGVEIDLRASFKHALFIYSEPSTEVVVY